MISICLLSRGLLFCSFSGLGRWAVLAVFVALGSSNAHAQLVGRWVAEDWAGGAADWNDRVSGLAATTVAASSPTRVVGAIPGSTASTGLVFDGVDDYFLVPASQNPIAGKTSVTIAAFFNTTQGASGADGAYWRNPGPLNAEAPSIPNDWGLTYDAAGNATAFFNTSIAPAPAVSLIDGQPHSMVLTWQDPTDFPGEGVARLYVDGVLVGSTGPTDFGDGVVANEFRIGVDNELMTRFFSGAIAELRFYESIEDPLALHLDFVDCDGNGVSDDVDLAGGASDCNANGVIDSCEVTRDLIAEGGFEFGGTDWTSTSTNFGTVLCDDRCGCCPASGSWWGWFGGISGVFEEGTIEQSLVIEPGATNLELSLFIGASGNGLDNLQVLMDGTLIRQFNETEEPAFSPSFARTSIDISAYADGGTHVLRFQGVQLGTDGSGGAGSSNFFVDDIAILVPDGDCDGDGLPDECGADCDGSGSPDTCDLASGGIDCNTDGVLDACQLTGNDCDINGVLDSCEIASGAPDCNADGVLDACQLTGNDCNINGVLDSCEIAGGAPDCNADGVLDSCQIFFEDCNLDGVLDECQLAGNDCDANGTLDDCDLAGGGGDCDANGVLDACQLASEDCDGNGTVDACDLAGGGDDCDANGVLDACQLASEDCNGNGTVDSCDIAAGVEDCDGSGLPDTCELGSGDCNVDGVLDDCQLAGSDCDFDGTLDVCQLSPSNDCDGNGTLDECEARCGAVGSDCNCNAVLDPCEIANGSAADCNMDGLLDECEPGDDCNSNGVPDICDILNGAPDCDGDDVPDSCELDCNGDGIPDGCEGKPDCNENGVPDSCEVGLDCNGNSVPDECDPDCDLDGTPDDCAFAAGAEDCNGNGIPDSCDALLWASSLIDFTSQLDTVFGAAIQALGVPDTLIYGLNGTAWIPANITGTLETITLGYAPAVQAEGVTIRETDNNGFVTQVELIDTSGTSHTVWSGMDPSLPGMPVDFEISFPRTPYLVEAVRVTIDTDIVFGFEAIDAVAVNRGAPCVLGSAFCVGTGCPCGNDDATAGCVNSSGAGGRLFADAAGSASFTSDDYRLDATHGPGNSGLLLVNTVEDAPLALFDGLNCVRGGPRTLPGGDVGGTQPFGDVDLVASDGVRNLGSTTPGQGLFGLIGATFPGFIAPGSTYSAQFWYRDVLCGPPPSPCPTPCGTNSNFSNGWTFTVVP